MAEIMRRIAELRRLRMLTKLYYPNNEYALNRLSNDIYEHERELDDMVKGGGPIGSAS